MILSIRRNIRSRGGFTLIELLVVIAIIGVLAGLLLPAVRKAREKARQADCANNLHQFSVSVIVFRDDHEGTFPGWLSDLYPDYLSKKGLYVCSSDPSGGLDGAKPDGMADQFPEADDIDNNPAITNCSYMYEFNAAACSISDIPGWLGVSEAELDTDGDGQASWQECKLYQLQNGDTFHSGPYDPTIFPVIRCFHHHQENDFKVDHPTYGVISQGLTINVAYAGNVYRGPLQWELKPIDE